MRGLWALAAALAFLTSSAHAQVTAPLNPPSGFPNESPQSNDLFWIERPYGIGYLDRSTTFSQVQSFFGIGVPGTGASVSTTLPNRATDGGVTFNLKNDFGAACNGSTDDTAAIRNWLNKAGPGVRLVAPAGTCPFSAPLTITAASNLTVSGAGPKTTIFEYTGTDYNGTVTAGASWSAAATSITLASATLPTNVAAAYAAGYALSAYDTTTGKFVGSVSAIVGTTLTLAAGAPYASSGASDAVHLTADLITFGTASSGGQGGVKFADFSVISTTTLTGGYALHMHALFDGLFDNVWADDANSVNGGHGDLCGGFWIDGAGTVNMTNPNAYSVQNCGDAVTVNSAQGGSGGLSLRGGAIGGIVTSSAVTGFVNGIHVAGGFGGVWCDGGEGVHDNLVGILIDNAVVAAANREANVGSTCSLDTNQNAGLLVNDSIASGGTIDVDGWEASALTGHGIVIESWPLGDVEIRGNKIYNNCGSGVYVQDTTTHVLIAPGEAINTNGSTHLYSTCATWKSANTGHGYGIEAASSTSNVVSFAAPFNNTAGASNVLTGLLTPSFVPYANLETMWLTSSSGNAAKLIINTTSASEGASLVLANAGTSLWQFGAASDGTLKLYDIANSSTPILNCTTGGTCTIGESAGVVTALNNFAVDGTSLSLTNLGANPSVYINGPSSGGASVVFELNGVTLARVGTNQFGTLEAFDQATSAYFFTCASGGNCTFGETSTDVETIEGGLKRTQFTVATLPTCNSGEKGVEYDVTDATSPTWNATLSGLGAVFVHALCNGTNWTAH